MYKSGTVLGKVNNTENKTNSGTYKSGMVLGKVSESALRTEQSSVKMPHYKESSQNQAKQQSTTDFLFSQLPTGNVRQDINNQQQMIKSKTTIPSVSYDEGFATELKLKKEMSEAEKAYKEAQSTFNINPVMKDFSKLGLADDKKVQPYKDAYESKKKEYEKYKKARYYSAFPNGEIKTTNTQKKKYNSSGNGDVDWKYEYINDIDNTRANVYTAKQGFSPYTKYEYMTDREKGIYNYLYSSKGKEEAEKFLDFIDNDLEERVSAKIIKGAQEQADEHPYISAAVSLPTNLLAAGEQIGNMAESVLTGETKRNMFADVSSALRGALPEKVNWEINNWDAFDFLYNTGMSALDSLVVAPLGTTGALALGLSAAASTTNDIIDRGGTNEQAFWGGIAAGVFEGFFEKFSLGQLETMQEGMVKGFKDYAKNVGKSMLVNASEETATEVANVLYDYAANGGISQFAMIVKEYMQDPNIDETTAKKKAAQKLGLQILEAGASGALMGFGFGSLGSAAAYDNYKKSTNKEYITLEEFSNRDSKIWRNVDYSDNDTKAAIMNETHNRMVAEGKIIKVSEETQEMVGESFPDLRSMKKKERTPILKEAMDTLKNNLRQFLNGFKNQSFEFEVNGKVLEATLYNTGINEVLEKITQEKANMLYSTDEIFKKSCYLYSTPDYDGDPNVYRWNYFYTPVQIGEETVGVRIAVRDLAKQGESQIYNWGIKKDVSLDGIGDDSKNRKSNGVSSDTSNEASQLTDANSPSATSQNGSVITSINDSQSLARNGLQLPTPPNSSVFNNNIPQGENVVNNNISTGAENNSTSPENSLDSMLDESEDGESRPTFREPKKKEIFRSSTAEEQMNTVIGKHENIEQRHLKDIAKKLGVNLRWDNDCTRGYYDTATNTIVINPFWSVTKCYYTIFKHEFVHYLETKKGYESYKNYLINHSKAFDEYVRGKLNNNFAGNREEALSAYTDIVLKERQAAEEIPYRIRKGYNAEKIHREIIADFVGDVLLGGESVTKAEQALLEIAETNRSLFQKIKDWLSDVISFLKGEPKNRTLVEDLEYLNNRLARVWNSAEKRDSNKGEIKFSSNGIYGNESRFIVDTIYENINSISEDELFFVKTEKIPEGMKKSEYVLNIFEQQGKIANNNIIGEVELAQSGAKSTVFHGFGAEKLAATKAIKSVIESGNIIKKTENYNNSGVDRYVIAAKGRIEGEPSYIGVIVKAYPKQKNEKAKFYLHEAIIIKTDSPIMTAPQLSVDAVSESVSTDIISKNKPTVNNNSTQESKNYSDDSKFSHKNLSPINDSEKFAAKMLRQNRSSQDKAVLAKQLNDISNAIAESDYGRAMKLGIEAARGIIESSKNGETLTDDAVEILKDIRKTAIKLSDTQKQEVAYAFGSYNDFRKRNMGRINLNNEGVELDTAWQSWSEQYPQLFEQDMPSGDMPVALANIIDSLKADYVDFDFDSAVDNLASQIFTECIKDMQGTQSENVRKAITELEEMHREYVIDSARYTKQLEKRVKRQNEQLAKRSSEISAEITAQREERASKQRNIEHIRKTVSRIDKMFRTNSNTKHIPEELKDAAAYFVRIFVDNDVSAFDKKDLQSIRTVYGDLADGEIEISGYDEEIKENIKTLEKRLAGKTLRQLDYYDTLLIRNIVDNFNQIINNENEIFLEGKKQKVDEIGHQALKELTTEKSKRENGITDAIDKSIKYSNMTPIYFFDRIGGVFKSLFNDVVRAQDKWYRNAENAKTYIRQMKEKYNYSTWDNDTFKFTTEKGDVIELTREQAMLLYATARRENKNKVQNAEHLFRGGVVIPPSQNTLKAILKKYKESDANGIAKITDAMVKEIDSKSHKILPQDVAKLMQWLTEDQIEYVNAMVEYLSKDMAALGNEVSLQLYGITKYNEEYYIPYNSAQNYLYSQPGVTNESRLKHQSFTKDTVRGANNPLVLSDFSEVCADHINRMCMYNALTIPLENMNKIFNFSVPSTEDTDIRNIKAEIERVHGTAAVDYIKQFLLDMNGNVRTSGTDKAVNRWISRFKKGAVFASASVVVQQPSAVMRAMTYINPKYFRSTTLKLSERDYQQAVEHAPVAGIKEMGRFDTGVGAATTNWLLQETPKGFKNKVKAFVDIKDSTYRDDKLSWFAAKADEMTWAHIWAAVKAEITDTTNLSPGTEEFFKVCGERFTEVINYTQVYDSTISRSQIMRDKSTSAQMLTAFMSEPTVSLNVLMNAVHQAKTNGNVGRKFATRAVGAFVGNVVLNSLLKSLVIAGRDDDEDETYFEKYSGEVIRNIISDINPLGMIPFVKDILSVFEGYTVERADMNLFSDLAQSVKILQNDNKTIAEKIESISGSLAAFLGLPVKNVLRDVRTVYNIAVDFKKDIIDDKADTDFAGIKYAITDSSNSQIFEKLTKAAENDDEEEYQRIYKNLIDNGKNDSDIISGIKRVYKDSKEVKKETEEYVDKLENNKTYKKLDEEDKKTLKNNIASSLATEKTINAIDDNVKKYDELYAMLRRNKKAYERMRKEMLAEGYTDKQISDGVEIARIAYMKSIGIDIHEYLLYKIATNKKNADIDKSGGVSKGEKNKIVQSLDLDSKAKNYFTNEYK